LPPEAAAAAETGIDGAIDAAGQLPGDIGEALTTAAQQAFTSGLNAAGITSAVIAAVAAIIAAVGLRHIRPTRQPHDAAAKEPAHGSCRTRVRPCPADARARRTRPPTPAIGTPRRRQNRPATRPPNHAEGDTMTTLRTTIDTVRHL